MADDNVGQDVINDIKQPFRSVYERVTHFFDPAANAATKVDKPQQMNWKPEPNAEQQKYLDERAAPTKEPDQKPLSQRTLGGKKRPPIKKPTDTQQTQRKQP